jgi:F-type H+-transporting ATPase subunit alpha
LFYSGVRPAINVGISVSRVGGSAQTKATKQVAGRLRLDLAQFRELAAFAAFGSDLDEATQAQLTRGERLVEILKQGQYKPMSMEEQVALIYCGVNGHLDELPIPSLAKYEEEFIPFIESKYPGIYESIRNEKKISDETEEELVKAITDFKDRFEKE